MKKIAIVTTHPIQYNAPWFRLLNEGGKVRPKVFYTWSQLEQGGKYDPGFGKTVQWDIPLLEGYEYSFVQNTSSSPGSHHRKGIINPTLIAEIEQWQPDAVLVFGWNFVSHFKCMQYFKGKTLVLFRGDSTLLRKQSFIKSKVKCFYLKWVYSFVDYALFVGSENKKYFLKYGLKENQLIFAPHAIDNNRFADNIGEYQMQANAWRMKLGIDENSLCILYAGKLEVIKAPWVFIDFTNNFIGQPVNFIIAGNGLLEKDLKNRAAGNPNIHFMDFQNQKMMPVVYRLADFFMLSSQSETWGLGINEAMACGRAIIARNTCGSVADLVRNKENGFVFNEANMNYLQFEISNIINNRPKWKEMGEVSKSIIEDYSFKNIVNAIEHLLDQ